MLNRHVQNDFARILPAACGGLRIVSEDMVQFLPDAMVVGVDLRKARPVGGLVRRKAAAHRIDAESKEAIKFLVSRSEAQRLTRDQIPVECLEVADVENNSVPFRNGTVIQGVSCAPYKTGHRSPTAIPPSAPKAGYVYSVVLLWHSYRYLPLSTIELSRRAPRTSLVAIDAPGPDLFRKISSREFVARP